MADLNQPLVAVVTPVHNGEPYIKACISSVLDQTYRNWEYTIVNNASTDATEEIARAFSARDSRIRVVNTDRLLPIMENWNLALREVASESVYTKIIHADDFLMPRCLETMVHTGNRYPTAAMVGSYAFFGNRIGCSGLPLELEFVPGPEICRRALMRSVYPFLSPSCLLLRSEIVLRRKPFYGERDLHADVQVCYEILRHHDFAFTHEILTYIRRHDSSVTSTVANRLNTLASQNLDLLVEFGPAYLNEAEYRTMVRRQLASYQRFLSRNLRRRDKEFWDYHERALESLGFPLSRPKLYLRKAVDMLHNRLMRLVTP